MDDFIEIEQGMPEIEPIPVEEYDEIEEIESAMKNDVED